MKSDGQLRGLLQSFWPDLHAFAVEADTNASSHPAFAIIRLRGFAEAMIVHLFKHVGLPLEARGTQYERLKLLDSDGRLDARLLSKFHTIRKLGNLAAHNRPVSAEQAVSLVEDAWSLAAWFCRYMRPDAELAPPDRPVLLPPSPNPLGAEGDSAPDTGSKANIVRSSNERAKRIHENVAAATAQLDDQSLPLRTRIGLCEVFETDLNEDQERCLSALEAFLADETLRVFLLKGYAGTGKTFLTAGLTEFLLTQGRRFSLAAPTGRAAKVIAAKTGQSARTLHSLIYDYSDITELDEDGDDGSATFKVIAKVAPNQEPINAVYIVDEASLISDVYAESEFFRSGSGYLLSDLIAHVGSCRSDNGRKIIFIGDPAQLPPVGMSSSPALAKDYLREKFRLEAADYELTEVVRQKADSAVLRNIMPLRESLAKGRFSSLSFIFEDDVIRLNTGQVTTLYFNIRERRGLEAPIIVTYSNAEAAGFNRAIRARLFPDRDFVSAGDRVIVAANGFCATHYIANGEILRIESVEPVVERRSVQMRQKIRDSEISQTLDVALHFRDVTVAIPQSEGDDLILSTKILDDFLHGNDASLDPVNQRALYVDFLRRHKHLDRKKERAEFQIALRSDPYFNALRLRFGYAITCHKAQGGEWTHVIANCATTRNPRWADYFRWLYTAMTRTSSKLYLVDPPDVVLKPPTDPAGDWVTPTKADNSATQTTPAPRESTPSASQSADEIPKLSLQAIFRQWLEDEVRQRLSGADVEIEDIAHHPYREAYFLKLGAEAARIDISYNGNWTIAGLTSPRPCSLSEDALDRLTPIVGRKPSANILQRGPTPEPTRPFLRSFHDRLLAAMETRRVGVTSLKERDWSLQYTFSRDPDAVVVDIFYNGREQITKFRPVNPVADPWPHLVELQDDVRTILLKEVRP